MRNLTTVIDQILKVIPDSEIDIAYDLLDLKSSAMFAAPETMPFWWQETADYLNENVQDFTQEWAQRVFKIFTNTV